jgi:hypothetical protein
MKTTLINPMRVQRLRKKGFNLQKASRHGFPVKYVGRPTTYLYMKRWDRKHYVSAIV